MSLSIMHLSVFLPTSQLLKEEVSKVKGESLAGEFTLKPRHIDYVTALAPGIFSYVTTSGQERFLAMDYGILVKQGEQVKIATRLAISGELGQLSQEVEKMLEESDDREAQNRTAIAKLEVGFLKRFLDFSHRA